MPAALLACAMNVSPVTLEAVVRVESGGNSLALNVNHLQGPQPHPATPAEAVSLAQRYIAQGYSVDIGLMQVNSRNLPALGYTVEQVLDPCTNIRAGGHDPGCRLWPGRTAARGRSARLVDGALGLQHRGFRSGFRERLCRPLCVSAATDRAYHQGGVRRPSTTADATA